MASEEFSIKDAETAMTDGSADSSLVEGGVEVVASESPIFGEISLLVNSLEDSSNASGSVTGSDTESRVLEEKGVPAQPSAPKLDSQHVEPVYGKPLSREQAEEWLESSGTEGLVRHATVVPDVFVRENGRVLRGLNPRDYSGDQIKPRRPTLPITASQLMSSLTEVGGGRYVFHGILNGWPSLQTFELVEMERRRTISSDLAPARLTWQRVWTANDGKDLPKDTSKIYRAKLRGASWTSIGWSEDSPGFMFWYEAQRTIEDGPRITYGLNAVNSVGDDKCTNVHMLSHRYAVKNESPRDKVTYHSVILLEWEHGNYCTVIEAAYLNGIGGYQGRSNWYADKDDKGPTALYRAFPAELIQPWLTTAAEIRCYDVASKNLKEFQEFLQRYKGPEERFVDPQHSFSHPARLTYRTKSHIAQYLVNYIGRDYSYSDLRRNCQTFAADLCAFLAGKKDVQPYHPIVRIDYHNRTHMFLYESSMFRKAASLK